MIVLVLGMHRSGTSLVAGLLQGMGINMGDELITADRFNPYGYYEDTDFFHLNREILRAAGGNWAEPPGAREILAVGRWFGPEMSNLVDYKRTRARGDWGWKDPRTCLTAELWLAHLQGDEVRLVHVDRDPDAVVGSLMRRQAVAIEQVRQWAEEGRLTGEEPEIEKDEELAAWGPDEWHALRYGYQQRARDVMATHQEIPWHVVSYDALTGAGHAVQDDAVLRLAHFVGRDPEQALEVARGLIVPRDNGGG